MHNLQYRLRQNAAMEHWSLRTRVKFYLLPIITSSILCIAALTVLIYAEYNSTLFHYASDESSRSVVRLENIYVADESNDGKLIHFTGNLHMMQVIP